MMIPKAYLFLSHCCSALATSVQKQKQPVAKALTRDEARRIAANIATLPELMSAVDPKRTLASSRKGGFLDRPYERLQWF